LWGKNLAAGFLEEVFKNNTSLSFYFKKSSSQVSFKTVDQQD